MTCSPFGPTRLPLQSLEHSLMNIHNCVMRMHTLGRAHTHTSHSLSHTHTRRHHTHICVFDRMHYSSAVRMENFVSLDLFCDHYSVCRLNVLHSDGEGWDICDHFPLPVPADLMYLLFDCTCVFTDNCVWFEVCLQLCVLCPCVHVRS